MKKSDTRKVCMTAGFVLLNIAVILFTALREFTGDHGDAIKFSELEIRAVFFIPAVLCSALAILFESLKYDAMLRMLEGKRNLKLAFETAVFGKYYDCVTPFGAGGQPFQMRHLYKNGIAPGRSGAMPVLGFLGTQLAFILIAIFVFLFGNHVVEESVAIRVMAYFGLLCYLFVPTVILAFTFFPRPANAVLSFGIRLLHKMRLIKDEDTLREKVLSKVEEYDSCVRQVVRQRKLCLDLMALSVAYQVALCSVPFFVIWAFGGTTDWISAFVTTVFIYAAITFIPTPGNSGAAEVSFYAVFSMLTSGYIFWAMLSWRFLSYYIFILAGISVYAFRLWKNRKGIKRNG